MIRCLLKLWPHCCLRALLGRLTLVRKRASPPSPHLAPFIPFCRLKNLCLRSLDLLQRQDLPLDDLLPRHHHHLYSTSLVVPPIPILRPPIARQADHAKILDRVPLRAVDAVERDSLLRGSLACRRADHQVHDVVAPLSAQSRASSHVRTVPSIVACTLPCTCRPCAASCTLPATRRSGSPSDPTRRARRAWPWRSSQSPSSKARAPRLYRGTGSAAARLG